MPRKLSIMEFTQRLEALDAESYVAVEGQTMTLDLVKFLRSEAGKKSLRKVATASEAASVEDKTVAACSGG